MAPPYAPPAVPTPAQFKEARGWQAAGMNLAPAGRWWEIFGDPILNGLEGRIEAGNPSLAAAVARYDEARGLLGEANAARFPEVGASASAERTRISAGRPLSPGSSATYNEVTVGPSLTYEIDLFGRVRNSVRAARAGAEASAADVAATRLGLQAQLASTYFEMRGLDARTVLLSQTVDAYRRAYDLTSTRHDGGIDSGVDVSRARTLLATARAELNAVAIERQRDEHVIAVLIGDAPAALTIPVADQALAAPTIPAGLPSTLLERRPDVAAAERRVAEANAKIGVARAALFPSLTLELAGGFQASSGALLSAANSFWALGPLSAAMAIFDGGRRRAGVRVARAQFDEAAANYRETVLTAFREVEDDLASQRLLAAQERDQREAAAAADHTRDLALIRYRDGAADYLEVATAQTTALDAERALVQVRTQQMTTAVDTVRAIGGLY
ncbi:efflux transporter outer membrane subunit [Sphingomonas ginsengisoli (ex An et al. 2013)]|nr:efflux transporter outer membrane subunit [Sphingomonas ginsengisoli An et al. 2013]